MGMVLLVQSFPSKCGFTAFSKLEVAGFFQFHHVKEELNLLDSFSKAPTKTKFY